jgi:hypothetical protein
MELDLFCGLAACRIIHLLWIQPKEQQVESARIKKARYNSGLFL